MALESMLIDQSTNGEETALNRLKELFEDPELERVRTIKDFV